MPTKLEIVLSAIVLFLVALIIFFEVDRFYNDPLDPFSIQLGGADYQVSCAREKPTNLFLNFYGNSKESWLAIILGKNDKYVAMLLMFRNSGSPATKTLPMVLTLSEWRPLWTLNEVERKEYEKKMDLSAEELKFLDRCMAPKVAI